MQYHIRVRYELDTMPQSEFYMLIGGLMPDTPLGQLVSIRSEKDPEKLKHFSPTQKKIRNEWRSKHSLQASEPDYDMLKGLFSGLAK